MNTAPNVGTRRVIWTCPCGATRALDYVSTRRFRGVDKWGCAQYSGARLTRVHPDGVERDISADVVPCACGRMPAGTEVRGRVTAHKCDARCLASKGPQCECACGGRNHGSAYL